MSFDFSASAVFIIATMSNADIVVGTNPAFRGIYDAPDKQASSFGETLTSFDPQVSLLQTVADQFGIKNGTAMTVTRDLNPDAPLFYQVKHVSTDGAGLAGCTLKRA
jgi:hypothetical protein